MIEHADLFDQAQRRSERQEIDHRPETHAFRRARDRAEPDSRHRNHIEPRAVMFGDVIGIESRLIGRGDELQPLVELRRERPVRAVDMVEEADFHIILASRDGLGSRKESYFYRSAQPLHVMPALVAGIHAEPTAYPLKNSAASSRGWPAQGRP
jgi:hypothetical protein